MRYMMIVKAAEPSERGVMPTDEQIAEMGGYHEELAKAGVLLDASGLRPTSDGWRVRCESGQRTVVDGPFTDAKELVAGYTIIEVESEEEAREWVRRFPNPSFSDHAEIEVRRLYDLDDLEQGPAIKRFRELELPSQQ